jgi:DnaJ like chaperone protein
MGAKAGKIVGALVGFLIGGPTGAAFGFLIGHLRDVAPELARAVDDKNDAAAQKNGFSNRFQQSAYTLGVIVLSAKMAKSDGRVCREEIDAFRRIFKIDDDKVGEIGLIFDQARLTPFGFEPYAQRLAEVFRYRRGVLEEVLTGLIQIALADSPTLSSAENAFLRSVGAIFGFSESEFQRVLARGGLSGAAGASHDTAADPPAPDPDREALALFGLPPTAPATQIKRTYHALIRKHHPDKLVAQGLPPELIAQATEKMKRINAAYAVLCKNRGIR